VLHLIVSLFIGFWALIWFIFKMTGGVTRHMIRVDEAGNITTQPTENSGNPTWAKIVSGLLTCLWVVLLVMLLS